MELIFQLQDNVLVEDTRTSYRRLEGIVSNSGTEKILAPASAEATVADGKILMLVTPNDLVGAATPEKCDPFAYVVSITDEQGMTKEHVMYTEEASFDIPAGMSGTLKIAVRSKSMYDNIEESEPITAEVRRRRNTADSGCKSRADWKPEQDRDNIPIVIV